MQARPRPHSHSSTRRRRGVSTVWIIAAGPALLTLLVLVTDIGNLWRARVELETALEAAALAAVKQWGNDGGGATLTARLVGVDFAAANSANGEPVSLMTNYDVSLAMPNQNLSCDGNLVFGVVTDAISPYTVDAGESGGPIDDLAVRAQATAPVASLWSNLFGVPVGPYNVTVRTTARYRVATARSDLIRVGAFICP